MQVKINIYKVHVKIHVNMYMYMIDTDINM